MPRKKKSPAKDAPSEKKMNKSKVGGSAKSLRKKFSPFKKVNASKGEKKEAAHIQNTAPIQNTSEEANIEEWQAYSDVDSDELDYALSDPSNKTDSSVESNEMEPPRLFKNPPGISSPTSDRDQSSIESSSSCSKIMLKEPEERSPSPVLTDSSEDAFFASEKSESSFTALDDTDRLDSTQKSHVESQEVQESLRFSRGDVQDRVDCVCGRGDECYDLSSTFFHLNDPRSGYTALPDASVDEDDLRRRERFLSHVLLNSASFDHKSMEQRYVANHHFHPKIISQSSQGMDCSLPMSVSKTEMQRLRMDLNIKDKAIDYRGMPTGAYFLCPNYAMSKSTEDALRLSRVRRTTDSLCFSRGDVQDRVDCVCGRGDECYDLSSTFFDLDDPRSGYTALPDPSVNESDLHRRERFLSHVLLNSASFDHKSMEQRYVANHHFHPKIISQASQGMDCNLPMSVSKTEMQRLRMDLNINDKAIDYRGMPTGAYFLCPNYAMSKSTEDALRLLRVRRTVEVSCKVHTSTAVSQVLDETNDVVKEEARFEMHNFSVLPAWPEDEGLVPSTRATVVIPSSHENGNTTNAKEVNVKNDASVLPKDEDLVLSTRANVVIPSSHENGNTTNAKEINVKNDASVLPKDEDFVPSTRANVVIPSSHENGNTTNVKEVNVKKDASVLPKDEDFVLSTRATVVIPSSHETGNTTHVKEVNVKKDARLRMLTIMMESETQRRDEDAQKLFLYTNERNFSLEILRNGLQETMQTERLIVGQALANKVYADAMQAIYEDIYLDDNGNVARYWKHGMLTHRRANQDYTQVLVTDDKQFGHSKQKGKSPPEERSGMLSPLIQTAGALAEEFTGSATHLAGMIGSESTKNRKALQSEIKNLETRFSSSIVTELENAEFQVRDAWSVFQGMIMDTCGSPEFFNSVDSSPAQSPSSSPTNNLMSTGHSTGSVLKVSQSRGYLLKRSLPRENDCSDLWLLEMKYSVAVDYQKQCWRKALPALLSLNGSVAKIESDRLGKLQSILLDFVPRQRRLSLNCGSVHKPALNGLVALQVNANIEEDMKLALHNHVEAVQKGDTQNRSGIMNRSIRQASLGDIEGSRGVEALDSPMSSAMLISYTVIERRTKTLTGYTNPWQACLAMATTDSYMHFFDLPVNVPASAAPEHAFHALWPSIPTAQNIGEGKPPNRKLLKNLIPAESLFMPNCTTYLDADPDKRNEFEMTESGTGKFGLKDFNKKVMLRTRSTNDTLEFIEKSQQIGGAQ